MMVIVRAAALPICLVLAGPAGAQTVSQPAPAAAAPLMLQVPPPPATARVAPALPPATDAARMTTDTPEYCNSLHGRVDGMARDSKPPAEAIDLAREGQRLCETGKTRSGILHLRRAFILLRHPEGER